MRIASRPRNRLAAGVLTSCLVVVLAVPAPAGAAQGPTKLVGPVLTREESKTVSLSHDGGISVALPGGKVLWIFGDTPRQVYAKGKWKVKNFVAGTTAAIGSYSGARIPKPMTSIWVGHRGAPRLPARFIPPPKNLYMPGRNGKLCTKANGGAEAVRWPTGAALMPKPTYVLVTYVMDCVTHDSRFVSEGYGFMIYNWRNNRITVPPVDVYKPKTNGAALSTQKIFGSPIVANGKVTLFSATCCSPGHVFTVTMPATAAALKNPASYVLHQNSAPTSFYISVGAKTRTQPQLQLLRLLNNKGAFAIYTAPNPSGPWRHRASGVLPGCNTSPSACWTPVPHPEISAAKQLMISYYLPGYGPGVPGHPYPHPPLNHIVVASVPYAN